jgi:hypothetical protein
VDIKPLPSLTPPISVTSPVISVHTYCSTLDVNHAGSRNGEAAMCPLLTVVNDRIRAGKFLDQRLLTGRLTPITAIWQNSQAPVIRPIASRELKSYTSLHARTLRCKSVTFGLARSPSYRQLQVRISNGQIIRAPFPRVRLAQSVPSLIPPLTLPFAPIMSGSVTGNHWDRALGRLRPLHRHQFLCSPTKATQKSSSRAA